MLEIEIAKGEGAYTRAELDRLERKRDEAKGMLRVLMLGVSVSHPGGNCLLPVSFTFRRTAAGAAIQKPMGDESMGFIVSGSLVAAFLHGSGRMPRQSGPPFAAVLVTRKQHCC